MAKNIFTCFMYRKGYLIMNLSINTLSTSPSFQGKIPNINVSSDRIKRLAQNGKSIPQIARRCDIAQESVRKYLGRSGVQTPMQMAYNEITKEALEKLVKQGCVTGELSQMLGIDVLTADKLFKKFGIKSYNTLITDSICEYVNNPTQKNRTNAVKTVDKYLTKIAKNKVSANELCSYDDYLQNLRFNFLERLEECRSGKTSPAKVIYYMKQLPLTNDDLYLGTKGFKYKLNGMGDSKPVHEDDRYLNGDKHEISMTDMDDFYAEDKNILSFENRNYNSRFLGNLFKKLTPLDRCLLNARYAIFDDSNVKRGYDLDFGEVKELFCFRTHEQLRKNTEIAKRNLRSMINDYPKVKASLFDGLLKTDGPVLISNA